MTVHQYTESQLHQWLAEDERTAERGVRVSCREDGTVVLSGEVESPQRRARVEELVAEKLPGAKVICDIGVTRVHEPDDVEEL